MEKPTPSQSLPESDLALSADGPDATGAGLLTQMAYVIGGIGLLGATCGDALAVAGRHTGIHLLGSIEFVQSCVVLLAASAMLIATIKRNHASVHIVTDRLSRPTRDRLVRISAFISAMLFLVLAVGSTWILTELWNGHEETELLHIPLRWLRLLWIIFTVLIAARFLGQAWSGRDDRA